MAEEETYRGEWWLPEANEDKKPGVLRIDPSGRATLELVGGFGRDLWAEAKQGNAVTIGEDDGDRYWPMLHGQGRGGAFTLLDVSERNSHRVNFGAIQDQDLRAGRVLKGSFLLDAPDEATFTGVDVELDYLLMWSGLGSFEIALHFEQDSTKFTKSTAEAKDPESRSAAWGDYRFTLSTTVGALGHKEADPNRRTVAGYETAYIRIQSDTLKNAEEYDLVITKIQDLLTLSMDYPCAIRAVDFRLPADDKGRVPELRSYGEHVYAADSRPFSASRREPFFRLDEDIKFEDLIPRWMELIGKIDVAVQRILSIDYGGKGFLQAELLTICAGLEALHRDLYGGMAMADEEYETFLAQLLSGVDPKYHDSVKGRNGNDLSYSKRLRELVRVPDHDAVKTLLTNERKWMQEIQKGRNALAHANDRTNAQSFELQFRLLMVTRALCALVIGQELGVSAEKQRRYVVDTSKGFHARQFAKLLSLPKAAGGSAASAETQEKQVTAEHDLATTAPIDADSIDDLVATGHTRTVEDPTNG